MASGSHPLALPSGFSPDDIDPLTELTLILAKLRASLQPAQTPAASSSQSTQAPSQTAAPSSATTLSFKEIPIATDALKHKLQRARQQVSSLPGMQYSPQDQEAEVKRLEERIAMQTALLERLREEGLRFGKDEGVGVDRMEQ